MPKKLLKTKQIKACQYYIDGMSMRQAMIKAGYNETYASHNASQFLANKGIIKFIKAEQAKLVEFEGYKRQHFYKFLVDKLSDVNVEDKDKVQYAKLLQQLGGFNKELDLKEKELELKIKDVESDKQASQITINLNEFKETDE